MNQSWIQFGLWVVVGLVLTMAPRVSTVYAQQRNANPRPNLDGQRVASTPARAAHEQQRSFHLPPGFVIELVASEPQIIKPINLNFDASGRLFVSQSVEYPFVPSPDQTPRDAIKMLVDTDGDGLTETASTFADGLSIPVGLTPSPGRLIGFSVPNLYHFTDRDGDGRADERSLAYPTFASRHPPAARGPPTGRFDGRVAAPHRGPGSGVAPDRTSRSGRGPNRTSGDQCNSALGLGVGVGGGRSVVKERPSREARPVRGSIAYLG